MKRYTLIIILLIMLCSQALAYSFGQNKVNAKPQDFAVLQTMHFDIYFPKGEDRFGKTAALMAEEIYYYIKAEFKIPLTSRIPIIFYATKSEFQSTNIIYPLLSEGVGGFTESLRNRVVVPFEGSYPALEELLAHELTHAYLNAMDSRLINAFNSLRPTSFPFWFSEGLPEFLSIGGEDDYNNMFILDLVINDDLPKLQQVDGYLAYRLGESFLSYIADNWSREKVSEYFFAIKGSNNLDDATKKVFGMDFKDLESRWNYQLKRDYYPLINSHGIPMERFEQRTFHKKDGSYFNFAPRFSPDGNKYVYYSNAGARYSIWMSGTQGLAKPKLILRGEKTSQAEEFYYMRSTLSWFPDNRRIVFAAKTAAGDRIQILDTERRKIVQTIDLPSLDAIYEVDVAPDGRSLVLAAQKNMQSDLYLYVLETKELRQLTNDAYNDAHPRFSPDGSHIAFDSERYIQPRNQRYGLFADLSTAIFTLDIASLQKRQISPDNQKSLRPFWSSDGSKLLYISYQNCVANIEAVDLVNSLKTVWEQTMAGVFAADISSDGQYILISNYFDGAWDLYFSGEPLKNPAWIEYQPPSGSRTAEDLFSRVDFARLGYYARQTRAERKRLNPARQVDPRRPSFTDYEYSYEDSLRLFPDYDWDNKPDSLGTPPEVQKYKTRFALDSLWGGLAYSSSAGTIGNIELGLSDLLGNHGIGISLGISGKIEESNILLSYLYLKHRMDYGIGAYNFFDETLYRRWLGTEYEYKRLRERETGLYILTRYPLSRFFRIELDHSLYNIEQAWDYLPPQNVEEENWIEDIEKHSDTVYAPGLSFIHDNSLSGSTGPLVGWRAFYQIRKSFARRELDYLTNYLDLRSYTFFSRRYSLAARLNAAISTGKSPDRFSLDGYYGVRALEEDLDGERKVLGSMELRFPFFDYIALAFPVPLALGNIRGSIFADAGSVWDDNDKYQGMHKGKLQDIKLGYGFGPRLNLGYFVLKFDVTWQSDLSWISKPQYYLSLTEDF